eukprot:Mycagemm_TRINITY_DN10351_c1_g15::TRINITY_DN10351_c1_g15_i1::g.1199::m.1199 type:complete len:118 gc:universal TRINITY_DN10351_c1_g15_i1:1166-813(-)
MVHGIITHYKRGCAYTSFCESNAESRFPRSCTDGASSLESTGDVGADIGAGRLWSVGGLCTTGLLVPSLSSFSLSSRGEMRSSKEDSDGDEDMEGSDSHDVLCGLLIRLLRCSMIHG